MTISIINKNQKQILYYLYSFRYLTIKHLTKLFNHKDPHRVKVWTKDLAEKKLIAIIKNEKNPTIPFIFCLDTLARYVLQEDEDYNKTFLNRLYKEKSFSEEFINHNLFIVDIYFNFLANKAKDEELEFFTQNDLISYDYFPEDMPDAYISVESKEGANRYFLDLFDEYKKAKFLPRKRIKDYIKYSEEGDWSANTNNTSFPTILFVLPNEKRSKHIYHYGKAVLEKYFEDFSLYLTTQDEIRLNKVTWQEVK